jgi:restriction system protein
MFMKKLVSDRYVRMYGPLLNALREAGGEAPPREIMQKVADAVLGGTAERDRELKSGGNAAENEVAWARNNLREAGLIDGSVKGVWKLTDDGWKTHLDLASARAIGKHAQITAKKTPAKVEEELPFVEITESEAALTLVDVLRSLPPKGFERICQRLLRELGFAEVEVTGRSNDGGIDGNGVLMVNELVSFRVLFQCKRYQGSVGAPEVRNFRGAMSGRTDKGIFLTTGSFTSEARREAVREGVPPIELVDQERLVALMERHQLGVKPRTVFDVDLDFFEVYRLD